MDRQLVFSASCDIGDYLIIIDEIGKSLFEVEKKSGKSKCVYKLKDWRYGQVWYQRAEKYKDKIFFFPFSINNAPIIVYNFIEHEVRYIDLIEKSNLVNGGYQLVQRIDDSIWIFPVLISTGLLIFHMDKEDVEAIGTWKPAMSKIELAYANDYSKVGSIVEAEGKLYQTIVETNMVIEITKRDYEINIYNLPVDVKFYRSMAYDGTNFWIPDIDNHVVKWNPKQGMCNVFHIGDERRRILDRNAKVILCGKKYVWLIPYQQDNRIIRMEYQTGQYRFIDIFPDYFIYNPVDDREMFGQMHKNGNIIDIYPFNGNLVLHLDLENDCLLEQYEIITLPEEWSDQDILEYELQSEHESRRINPSYYLNSFIETVTHDKKAKKTHLHGQTIWHYLTSQL